ncbi:hypothetical protein BGZ46_004170 [Entomortierella lignicola]|nr:hypothetical protein BGZ46_004170 [Entomortierella lignicola]
MIFSTSTRSSFAVIYMLALAALTMLATTPLTAQADCTFACAGINTKIVFCGNVKNGFQNTMPTIGVDSQLDSCLCNQDNVNLYRSCLVCENVNTAMNITNQFISDCKITDSSRNLINGAYSRLGSIPSTSTYALALVAVFAYFTL